MEQTCPTSGRCSRAAERRVGLGRPPLQVTVVCTEPVAALVVGMTGTS